VVVDLIVFLLIVLAIVGGWTFWLFRRLAVAPGRTGAPRWAVLGVLIAGWAAFIWCMTSRDRDPMRWLNWIGLTWLAVVWYLTLFAGVLALIGFAVRMARGWDARDRVLRVGTPLVVVLALAVTGYGVTEAADPQVTRTTVVVDDLPPALDGMKVAVLSDLHVGPIRDAEFTRKVVRRTNAAKPDLVVLTGDLIDGTVDTVGRDLAPLADLEAPMGIYAVTGNHEYISGEPDFWVDRWRELGITPLRNSHEALADGLVVAGVEDLDAERISGQGLKADPAAALDGLREDGMTILLNHQPALVGELTNAQQRTVDLQLSGHTHGGQLFPFGLLVRLQQPVVSGLGDVDGVPVYVSRGAGAWGPVVRVLAEPEIPVLTLKRG
jgi:uncharacterized protein